MQAQEQSPQQKKQLKSKFSPYVHNDKSFKKSVLPLSINSKFEQKKQPVVEKKQQDSPKGIQVSENEVDQDAQDENSRKGILTAQQKQGVMFSSKLVDNDIESRKVRTKDEQAQDKKQGLPTPAVITSIASDTVIAKQKADDH